MILPEMVASWVIGGLIAVLAIAGRGQALRERWIVPFGLVFGAALSAASYDEHLADFPLTSLTLDPQRIVVSHWLAVLLTLAGVAGAIASLVPRWLGLIAAACFAAFMTRVAFGLVIRDGGFAGHEHFTFLPEAIASFGWWVGGAALLAFGAIAGASFIGDRRDGNGPGFTLGLTTAAGMILLLMGGSDVKQTVFAGTLGIACAVWLIASRLALGRRAGLVGGGGSAIALHGGLVTVLWTAVLAGQTPWIPALLVAIAPSAGLITSLRILRGKGHWSRFAIGLGATGIVLGAAVLIVLLTAEASNGSAGY